MSFPNNAFLETFFFKWILFSETCPKYIKSSNALFQPTPILDLDLNIFVLKSITSDIVEGQRNYKSKIKTKIRKKCPSMASYFAPSSHPELLVYTQTYRFTKLNKKLNSLKRESSSNKKKECKPIGCTAKLHDLCLFSSYVVRVNLEHNYIVLWRASEICCVRVLNKHSKWVSQTMVFLSGFPKLWVDNSGLLIFQNI